MKTLILFAALLVAVSCKNEKEIEPKIPAKNIANYVNDVNRNEVPKTIKK